MRMTLNKLQVTDKNLELRYEITNDSDHDIWVCEDLDVDDPSSEPYELYFAEDGQTIVIRRRLDVEEEMFAVVPMTSRYIRLRPGKNRIESISLTVPVRRVPKYEAGITPQGLVHANRLVIEVGYYPGDLPGMVRGILEVAEEVGRQRFEQIRADEDISWRYFSGMRIADYFGGLAYFNETNKDLSEEIRIPYTGRLLRGEQISRITVEDVILPYSEAF